jgi:hypothetical protein
MDLTAALFRTAHGPLIKAVDALMRCWAFMLLAVGRPVCLRHERKDALLSVSGFELARP